MFLICDGKYVDAELQLTDEPLDIWYKNNTSPFSIYTIGYFCGNNAWHWYLANNLLYIDEGRHLEFGPIQCIFSINDTGKLKLLLNYYDDTIIDVRYIEQGLDPDELQLTYIKSEFDDSQITNTFTDKTEFYLVKSPEQS